MDPFIAQIVMFGGNFAPRGWAFCEGQLLAISQNTAAFSLLGTTYGGDGRTSFALPDLRGRVPIHPGNGPGLPTYQLGEKGGTFQNVLNVNQLPSHNHNASSTTTVTLGDTAASTTLTNNYLAGTAAAPIAASSPSTLSNKLNAAAVTTTTTVGFAGGSQAVNNMPPYLAINFIIALVGTFPSRS